MSSNVVYNHGDDIYSTRACFKNLYFIDGRFEYFSLTKDVQIDKIMKSKNETLDIYIKYFKNEK